mmetsp:Transcript_22758/g.48347  ORF Transcript_22758/g.48347 Transcript_22758/m.48347 type:complete len:96 (-) Transcript_22758:6-293(-)
MQPPLQQKTPARDLACLHLGRDPADCMSMKNPLFWQTTNDTTKETTTNRPRGNVGAWQIWATHLVATIDRAIDGSAGFPVQQKLGLVTFVLRMII